MWVEVLDFFRFCSNFVSIVFRFWFDFFWLFSILFRFRFDFVPIWIHFCSYFILILFLFSILCNFSVLFRFHFVSGFTIAQKMVSVVGYKFWVDFDVNNTMVRYQYKWKFQHCDPDDNFCAPTTKRKYFQLRRARQPRNATSFNVLTNFNRFVRMVCHKQNRSSTAT